MRSARTSRMRAFVCEVSVTMPACEPVSEIASWPRSLITIAASAHEMRSPVESSMSISRGCGRSETSCAIATSSSVVFPRAERTATTSLPASFAATIRPAARLMRSASATEVPPNFMTTVSAMAAKDTLGPVRRRLQIPPFGPTALAVIAGLGIAAAVQDFRSDEPAAEPGGERARGRAAAAAGPRERTSFLAKLIPPPPEKVEGPSAPSSIADLARRLPLERKVAQLFLLGFEGQDLTAPIFEQMRRQDLGGLVFESRNYLDPQQIASMAGEGPVIAADEGHVPPFVMVSQEGGDFSEFPDLPPRAGAVGVRERRGGRGGRDRGRAPRSARSGSTPCSRPVIDVGTADGTGALDERAFSDDPEKVADYADRRRARLRRAARDGGAEALPRARRGRRRRPRTGRRRSA